MYKFKAKIWHKIPKEVCGDLLKEYKNLKNDYYNVIFFDTLYDMYKWYDKKYGKYDAVEHNYNGLCKHEYRIYSDDTISKNQGYILFAFDEIGGGVMAHEVTHAITFYFNDRIEEPIKIFEDIDISNYNELFAYMIGNMFRQINNKYYEYLDLKRKKTSN